MALTGKGSGTVIFTCLGWQNDISRFDLKYAYNLMVFIPTLTTCTYSQLEGAKIAIYSLGKALKLNYSLCSLKMYEQF